ncbi:methyltransferase, TIGR04325 family [Helicobacter brantae]|uniref:Methyltransferase, TIGR04325 family n=1 Tax=Helicobacter brantae TaxID=375927 RepID=A0A3D8J3P1_9HELI|nr:methyltransferase, TIGR04325 family [Helicobacter brantae]RDU72137.1 methyltransferase, TIGR04325 family [Helicobacter brantae]
MKHFIKSLIPPIALGAINKLTGRSIQWIGDFQTFQEAHSQAKGYDPDLYLPKLIEAIKIVRDDESKCERDSVLFDKITYPYPLLSNLFAIISHFQVKSLYILDFGGSLGSLYFQNRKFLRTLPPFTWNILEQEKIIRAGKEFFQTQELLFHSNLQEAKSHIKPQDSKILILSSVLQYLENPYQTLSELIQEFQFDAILIDRTPFSKDETHHIVLQKVPKEIYQTQVPFHIFSKRVFIENLSKSFKLFDEFESYCDAHTSRFNSLGFSFIKGR